MSSRVYATGHIKDPVPLIEKSRASCPSGRFHSPGNHHHQTEYVIRLYVLTLKVALDGDWA